LVFGAKPISHGNYTLLGNDRQEEIKNITSRALGHSDLRSTQTCLHLSQTDVEDASARRSILKEAWEK
jgi:hypothetical protein